MVLLRGLTREERGQRIIVYRRWRFFLVDCDKGVHFWTFFFRRPVVHFRGHSLVRRVKQRPCKIMAGPFKLPNKAEAEAEQKKRVSDSGPEPSAPLASGHPRVQFS